MRDPRLLERALRRVAERRIRAAMAAGTFDGLPGEGKPIPGLDQAYDPHWWIKSWLRRESLREELSASDPRQRALAALEDLRLSGDR